MVEEDEERVGEDGVDDVGVSREELKEAKV